MAQDYQDYLDSCDEQIIPELGDFYTAREAYEFAKITNNNIPLLDLAVYYEDKLNEVKKQLEDFLEVIKTNKNLVYHKNKLIKIINEI